MPSAVIGASPNAPAASNCAGHARARANPVAARLRSMSCDSSRDTRLHAFLRSLHPETTRHQTREPRDHAAPSDRRITTRRRLAGGVRRTGGQRHSVRGEISASVRGAISARVPPSSPSRATRDQHNSPATHSTPHAQHPCAHLTMHAPRYWSAGKKIHPAINFVSDLFEPRDTNPPTAGVPPGPAGSHACSARSFRSALPLRASVSDRCTIMLQVHTRTRACPNYVPAEARRPPRDAQLALAIGLFCSRLARCSALLPRCRQPQLRAVGLDGHRTLDISATTGSATSTPRS